jgi:hypothetical protein
MRKGFKRFTCPAKRLLSTWTREDLEWFGPPERNTLLHCVLDCCGSSRVRALRLSVSKRACVVTWYASPFIAKGGHVQGYWARACGPRNITNVILRATNVCCWSNLLAPWHPRSALHRRAGEASRIRDDEHSAPRSTGALYRQWTRQVRRLQGGPGAACQRSGQDTINAEGVHRLSAGWTGGASSLQ